MTKLNKVLTFIRQDNVSASKQSYKFTWKKFCKVMKCAYPCAETNYLSMLVKAQYVEKIKRGYYRVVILPGYGMSYAQLKHESSVKWNSKKYMTLVVKPKDTYREPQVRMAIRRLNG